MHKNTRAKEYPYKNINRDVRINFADFGFDRNSGQHLISIIFFNFFLILFVRFFEFFNSELSRRAVL